MAKNAFTHATMIRCTNAFLGIWEMIIWMGRFTGCYFTQPSVLLNIRALMRVFDDEQSMRYSCGFCPRFVTTIIHEHTAAGGGYQRSCNKLGLTPKTVTIEITLALTSDWRTTNANNITLNPLLAVTHLDPPCPPRYPGPGVLWLVIGPPGRAYWCSIISLRFQLFNYNTILYLISPFSPIAQTVWTARKQIHLHEHPWGPDRVFWQHRGCVHLLGV